MVSFWIKYLWQETELSLGWRDAGGMEGCWWDAGMLTGCRDAGGMQGCCGQGALMADSGVLHYFLQHSPAAPTSCVQVKAEHRQPKTPPISLTWELEPHNAAHQHRQP